MQVWKSWILVVSIGTASVQFQHSELLSSNIQYSLHPQNHNEGLFMPREESAPVSSPRKAEADWPKEALAYLPEWMTGYFEWHSHQKSMLNTSNWESYRYLVLRCSHEDAKCGGTSDRLKPIPLFLRIAYESQRILFIRWTRPSRLEEFLEPNLLNWSAPLWLEQVLDDKTTEKRFHNRAWPLVKSSANADIRIVEGRIQVQDGGQVVFSELVGSQQGGYESFYHHLFRLLFQAASPISKQVKKRMADYSLEEGLYSAAHYRAFYGVEGHKERLSSQLLSNRAINAANCASQLFPERPVYFASESSVAVQAIKNYAEAFDRPIVTHQSLKEPLHLDIASRGNMTRPPSDFYDTFADLVIMGSGRCVSHGVGGFGHFAQLLSFNANCSSRHFYRGKMRKCQWAERQNT